MRKVLLFAVLACCVSVFAGGASVSAQERINGAGATFIAPMMTKWAAEYKKIKGVEVNYQPTGSGAGIQQMIAQTTDFGCTDGPMTDKQLAEAKAKNGDVVHLPMVMGAVVPVYNLPVTEEVKFTGEVLADIYLGKIKKWNDPALQSLNPGVKLPDANIVVAYRAEGSGTTHIWADYLSKRSEEWKSKVGVGTSLSWPVGVGSKGNAGVSGFVKKTNGAIGYVELAYAIQNKIKYGPVKNKEGEFVQGSLESVTIAGSNGLKDIPEDLRYSLTDMPGKGSYPIAGTSWAIVYTNLPKGKGQAVVDFLHWCAHGGQVHCSKLDYASLPEGLVTRLDKRLGLVKVGN
jgi:phosphate transport system substrate-binding protein